MPNNIKASLSAVALLVAFGYAYWEWVTSRPDLAWIVIATGIFAVVAMWIFPEAMVKKRNGNDAKV